MRLYRPFCGSDEVQTSNYREKNTGRNKVSPSKLPRIVNLKTVEANGISVFIFADLREVQKCLRGSFVFVLVMSMLCIARAIVGNFPLSTLSRATLTREVPTKLHNNAVFTRSSG